MVKADIEGGRKTGRLGVVLYGKLAIPRTSVIHPRIFLPREKILPRDLGEDPHMGDFLTIFLEFLHKRRML